MVLWLSVGRLTVDVKDTAAFPGDIHEFKEEGLGTFIFVFVLFRCIMFYDLFLFHCLLLLSTPIPY